MKKLECIIGPHKFDEIRGALDELDIRGMTATEVRGSGRISGGSSSYRGVEYVDLSPKLKLEIVLMDDQVDVVTRAILGVARTGRSGKSGDGNIFISDIIDVVRIRTGDHGVQAL